MKGARNGVAEPRVEVDAGAAQVRVVSPGGGGDAGVQHLHMLGAGGVLQRMIQPGAQTTAAAVLPQVDARLRRPCVSGAAAQLPGVGVAQDLAVTLQHQIGVGAQRRLDALAEVRQRRHFIFKCNGSIGDVGRVDRQQRRSIIGSRGADVYHKRHLLSPLIISESGWRGNAQMVQKNFPLPEKNSSQKPMDMVYLRQLKIGSRPRPAAVFTGESRKSEHEGRK